MYRLSGSQKKTAFTSGDLFTRVSNVPFLHLGHSFFAIYTFIGGRNKEV